jgi:repressor LexA
MDLKMTSRQQEIFQFIKRYAAKYGYPPTVREIGKAVGLASSSTVHAHLANLEKYGVLRRDPTNPSAIELLFDKAKKIVGTAEGALPLVGLVAAGSPKIA